MVASVGGKHYSNDDELGTQLVYAVVAEKSQANVFGFSFTSLDSLSWRSRAQNTVRPPACDPPCCRLHPVTRNSLNRAPHDLHSYYEVPMFEVQIKKIMPLSVLASVLLAESSRTSRFLVSTKW